MFIWAACIETITQSIWYKYRLKIIGNQSIGASLLVLIIGKLLIPSPKEMLSLNPLFKYSYKFFFFFFNFTDSKTVGYAFTLK